MSLSEIEAELEKLSPEDLRRIAMKSWSAFVAKEGSGSNECNEDDPRILAALDEAIAEADAAPGQGHSASEVRARLARWSTR